MALVTGWGKDGASISEISVNVGETVVVTAYLGNEFDYYRDSMSTANTNVATASWSATSNAFRASVSITGVSPGTTETALVGGYDTQASPLTITVLFNDDDEYLNKRGLTHFWENIDDIKQDKLTAGTGIAISNNVISANTDILATKEYVASQIPEIPTRVPSFTNDAGYITNTVSNLTNYTLTSNLAQVATTGSYSDLTGKPTIPTTASDIGALSDRSDMCFYGTCSTADGTAAKVVVCSDFTAADLVAGTRLTVHFTNANSFNGQATLDVNSTGAKNIYYNGTTTNARYMWVAGETVDFVYNGTQWATINGALATTDYYGVTKLYNGAGSNSNAYALTPNALYAWANGAVCPYYSTSATYAVGDKVRYGNLLYECNTAIETAEAWTAAHWTALDPIQKQIDDLANGKQDALVSGTNIKTINNTSILGSGNIDISTGTTYTAGDNITISNQNVIDTADTVPLIGETISSETSSAFVNTGNIVNGAVTPEKMAWTAIIDKIYPIGSIYMSVTLSTAAQVEALLGGTWEAWGAGRVPVGVDATQTEFDTVEETGGEKTHTLTTSEMPSHTHSAGSNADGFASHATRGTSFSAGFTKTNSGEMFWYRQPASTGGGGAHNNLQPYITCYMYKRTA